MDVPQWAKDTDGLAGEWTLTRLEIGGVAQTSGGEQLLLVGREEPGATAVKLSGNVGVEPGHALFVTAGALETFDKDRARAVLEVMPRRQLLERIAQNGEDDHKKPLPDTVGTDVHVQIRTLTSNVGDLTEGSREWRQGILTQISWERLEVYVGATAADSEEQEEEAEDDSLFLQLDRKIPDDI